MVGTRGVEPPSPTLASELSFDEDRVSEGATTTAQLVWMLAPRLPEPGHPPQSDE